MCPVIRGDRALQEKDPWEGHSWTDSLFREPVSPFSEGRLGAVKGRDWVKRHSWDWHPAS